MADGILEFITLPEITTELQLKQQKLIKQILTHLAVQHVLASLKQKHQLMSTFLLKTKLQWRKLCIRKVRFTSPSMSAAISILTEAEFTLTQEVTAQQIQLTIMECFSLVMEHKTISTTGSSRTVGVSFSSTKGWKYVLTLNSFHLGTGFGEAGYFKIQRGRNLCGIANCVNYPILA